ncbi:MAG TPA: hypothetical protein DCS93_13765 [Microscillaceae bacterium]|nr:hypothetical protein [Microscillaceae bacterium]
MGTAKRVQKSVPKILCPKKQVQQNGYTQGQQKPSVMAGSYKHTMYVMMRYNLSLKAITR